MDPCFAWNCQVMAGVGVVGDIRRLYQDMHTYLAGMLQYNAWPLFEQEHPRKMLHIVLQREGEVLL